MSATAPTLKFAESLLLALLVSVVSGENTEAKLV
jgi:hypothetical protein